MWHLKNNDGLYVKDIDTANKLLTFTEDKDEAKEWGDGHWYAQADLEFIQFHFQDQYPKEIETMRVVDD